MTITSRQNNLLLNQDWKRIYQTFKNADFKSYDFENLRRVIISYLRENYPEDFNDYIESSEYLALVDAIAFVGQSLAFRVDLASRENFIELAETKESVLRLARLLAYNPKRNIPASGLLKFDTISTSEDVIDGNGKNLAGQTIIWNDPTNPNWYEQFILVLNSAMISNTEFGRSQGNAIIQGIHTEQYRFNSRFSDVPIFNFDKTVSNRRFTFEVVSTAFDSARNFYEESPLPGRQLGFVYRQDGQGAASPNTGFYLMVKQGSLESTNFSIDVPTTNEIITVDVPNINDTDVWLFSLDKNGIQTHEWVKVPALIGNNIVYNNLSSANRNIYNVVTKENDKIDLMFADGVYGNLPKGQFRSYYRVSNGLSYSISPIEMRGIIISIPYLNQYGSAHTLTVSLGLKYTITNSSESENIDSIRTRAPSLYYTQNRMVTGEDYNLAPLGSSQDIVKTKAVNRTSSGISRNFDIIDASGKYSSVNLFGDDGFIYKQAVEKTLFFKFANKNEIINSIRQTIEPLMHETGFYNFYLTKQDKIVFAQNEASWISVTEDVNQCTGYFVDSANIALKAGVYTSGPLRYLKSGAMVKFVAPSGQAFKQGQLVDYNPTDPAQEDSIWSRVVKVSGDGTNAGRGVLSNGLGAVVFNDIIPSSAQPSRIVPSFVVALPDAIEEEMIALVEHGINFGLRYDAASLSWRIITSTNLDLVGDFSLANAGDATNTNADSSWFFAFVKDPVQYAVRVRNIEYVFGSVKQNRFYFDVNQKTYDSRTGKTIKDQIKVLGINTSNDLMSPLVRDCVFEISDALKFEDGYQSTNEIKIGFADSDDDGIVDNPELFEKIVGLDTSLSYLFFEKLLDRDGFYTYNYLDNSANLIKLVQTQDNIDINNEQHGQLFYCYSTNEDRVVSVNKFNNTLEYQPNYKVVIGRANLKYQYIHNANVDRRIDPSVSNIIDLYVLTKPYDTAFRNYVSGVTSIEPTPPSSSDLQINYGGNLNLIKTISDEIIFYPVKYKVLFGKLAAPHLQAVFKVVKNPLALASDNDIKVRIVTAINTFFDVANWDFGDRFYLGELITYVTNEVAPNISNLVIVPKQPSQVFGSLFEIQSQPDEIMISGATVDDVEIVSSISAVEIGAPLDKVINTTR